MCPEPVRQRLYPVPSAAPTGAAARVVLVDDTAEIRLLLRILLEDEGLAVVGEAANGQQGVELVVALRPDLVILDVAMPVMDGFEALPLMRAAVPGAKVVMLSGFRRALCEKAAFEAGADAYVEKGAIDEVLQTVLRVCASRGAIRR